MPSKSPGLLDLERELSCSICTELLYHPLTLLDCLHTFCGSCLKEWFSCQLQAVQHIDSPDRNKDKSPFTCPACRGHIRETRPNATVTTLLDMYLRANPDKVRSIADQEAMQKIYQPGHTVLPPIHSSPHHEPRRHQTHARDRSRSRSRSHARTTGRYERGTRHQPRLVASSASTPIHPLRQVEHQSSLRSILSGSDFGGSSEQDIQMREEILRQIVDEGLLDGIDLASLDRSQEEELSERIAEAYRQRQSRRTTSPGANQIITETHPATLPLRQTQPQSPDTLQASPAARAREPSRRHAHSQDPQGATSTIATPIPTAQPDVQAAQSQRTPYAARAPAGARAHLLTPYPTVPAAASSTQRASSSARLSPTAPSQRGAHRASPSVSPSSRQRNTSAGSRNPTRHNVGSSDAPNARNTSSRDASSATESIPSPEAQVGTATNRADPAALIRATTPPSSSTATAQSTTPSIPKINCRHCEKTSMALQLHYHCTLCSIADPSPTSSSESSYDLCRRCFLLSRGCRHWFGFGQEGSKARYERVRGQRADEYKLPHLLQARRYVVDASASSSEKLPDEQSDLMRSGGLAGQGESSATTSGRGTFQHPASSSATNSDPCAGSVPMDPIVRLQTDAFCETCSTHTPDCYWSCPTCNEAEGNWIYCTRCVNTGRSCTHPLRPLQWPGRPLSISTQCNGCTYPIPPSTTRYHCNICLDGGYDLCATCWGNRRRRLQTAITESTSRSTASASAPTPTASNSPPSLPKADTQDCQHDLIRLGFEDNQAGQSRILLDADGPPGTRIQALWSYWPAEDVDDELGFPRAAILTGCKDVNGDWFFGWYAGRKGVFPANHGRVLFV